MISREPLTPDQVQAVARLNGLLAHRGPDGAGAFQDRNVALAMRRLSIIDLSTGWQPLYNEDESLALVANGEIYNYIELRRQLESKGHRFRTRSDCENILHLYEDYGDDCVHHLRGMYAFALWDKKKRRLLLCRDRMGEKPLYLAEVGDRIVFASELKALIGAGIVPFELDPAAVHMFFHYSYVPEPMSAVRGVRKLPAGSVLAIDVDRWRIEERCYWRLDDAPPVQGNPPTLIREELERVSELIIRSDVPVGVALSGGMDSSAIAVLAAKNYPGTMHAFSVGYAGRPYQDERGDARMLADHLKMPFHEVELATSDLVRDFPKMAFSRDDPIADIGGLSYYSVMKLARQNNVPVMLMGHGGDELFWGYRWVIAAANATRRKMKLHNGGGVGLADYLKVTRPPYSYTAGVRWLKSVGGLRSGLRQFRRDRIGPPDRMVFNDIEPGFAASMDMAPRVYARSFAERIRDVDPASIFTMPRPWPDIDITITRLICQTYLLENGIAQGDRLSMASSVELRLPLVDYKLAELVIGLRKVHSDVNEQPKRWLREALRDVIPPFVMARRKRGFTPPWRQWAAALADAYGPQLADGYLVEHGVLSAKGARWLAGRLKPARFGMPTLMSDSALLLEVWCREMSACGKLARASAVVGA